LLVVVKGEGKMSAMRSAEKDEWRVKEANGSIQEGVLKWSRGGERHELWLVGVEGEGKMSARRSAEKEWSVELEKCKDKV
jgi:hypothetical protein